MNKTEDRLNPPKPGTKKHGDWLKTVEGLLSAEAPDPRTVDPGCIKKFVDILDDNFDDRIDLRSLLQLKKKGGMALEDSLIEDMFITASKWRTVEGYTGTNFDLDYIDIRRQVAIRESIQGNGTKIVKAIFPYRKQWIQCISQIIPDVFEPLIQSNLNQEPIQSLYERADTYKKTAAIKDLSANCNNPQTNKLSFIESQPIHVKELKYSKYALPRDLMFKYVQNYDATLPAMADMPNVEFVPDTTLLRRSHTDRVRTKKELTQVNIQEGANALDVTMTSPYHGYPNDDGNEYSDYMLPPVTKTEGTTGTQHKTKDIVFSSQLVNAGPKFDFDDQRTFNVLLQIQMARKDMKEEKNDPDVAESDALDKNERLTSVNGGGTYRSNYIKSLNEQQYGEKALEMLDKMEEEKAENETIDGIVRRKPLYTKNALQAYQESKGTFVTHYKPLTLTEVKLKTAQFQADLCRGEYVVQTDTQKLRLREGKDEKLIAFDVMTPQEIKNAKVYEELKYGRPAFTTNVKAKKPFKGVARSSSRLGQLIEDVSYEVADKLRVDELWYKGYKERETESRVELDRTSVHHTLPMQLYFPKTQLFEKDKSKTKSAFTSTAAHQKINASGGSSQLFRTEVMDGLTAFHQMLAKTKVGRVTNHDQNFNTYFKRLSVSDKDATLGQQFS